MDKEKKIKKLSAFVDDASLAIFDEVQELNENLESLNKAFKGVDLTDLEVLQGEKGEDGHTPTEEELLSLITPLIPEVKDGEDGKTPSKKELSELIKPLIPKVEDGVDGEKGDTGPAGKDGSPDTGLDIKAKLLALSEEDKLKLKDFGGFDELVARVERIGNRRLPIPQSGITTTFFSLNGAVQGRAKNVNFVSGAALGVVLNGDTATITIPTGGSGGTVSTTDSVVGQGSTLDPIRLENDVTTPGTFQYYGTAGSPATRGYHNLPTSIANAISVANDPTVNNDSTQGYGPTSRWFNMLKSVSYVCWSAAPGAADWRRELFDLARSNLGSGVDPTVNDDATLGYQGGSLWYNIINKKFFICSANTPGNATWDWFASGTGPFTGGYTVVPANYGTTAVANANDHIIFTGGTGSSIADLSALTTIGDIALVSDLDRISASNQIRLDAGTGRVIVGNMSSQYYDINTNGQAVMVQLVTATQFKLI